jgi:hypothetical protein
VVLPCMVHSIAELRSRICQYLNGQQPEALPSVGMCANSAPAAVDLEAMAALYHVEISQVSMACTSISKTSSKGSSKAGSKP